MILIEILLLVVVFKTVLFVLKANKKKQLLEQKAQELASQQQARLAARLAREAERKARVAEVQAQRQAEREAREASLISKYLSSDRSKKLGLTEKDITITYVTETVTYKNGSQKTITYPKVVRI